MKDGLHERLAALLADVCGAPVSSLGPEAAQGVTPGWDSYATMYFIAAIEDELAISITTAEAMTIKSLGDMARLVAAKLEPEVGS
jgi:acyl carrier protein